jgi:voltage-gated potassium channel
MVDDASATREHLTVLDILMVSLAIVSLGLLLWEDAYNPTAEQRDLIIKIDLAIVAIFAIEFLIRVARAKDKRDYVVGHWYDLIGMIPVSTPFFRAFRLARLVRVLVIGSRFVRATNRTFGGSVVERIVGKYTNIIVEGVTDPIVLVLLDRTEEVLTKGSYGTSAARALDRSRDAIIGRINEQLKTDRTARVLLATPGLETLVEKLQERMFNAIITTLGSREMDATIVAVIQEIIADLRREVKKKEWHAPKAVAA